jgi:N-acetylglucosaminyl-diphospho-decaprenol L-rhamnosyltransferase
MRVDLSIIIVTWNVWDLLRASIASIEQLSRAIDGAPDIRAFGPATLGSDAPTLEVIVVDNASTDATADLLPARFPWVRLIRSATNLGFTAGNNVGYATSRGQVIYFLNPDTELVNSRSADDATTGVAPGGAGDSLWTLYCALLENPKVALVGPQLRYGDNTIQGSRRRFPTRLTGFFAGALLGRRWRRNPWIRHFEMDDWPEGFRQEVEWVVGAAMMARRNALEQIKIPGMDGPFDEAFFMYSEEVDLCKRLYDAGWSILYVPEAVVIHYQGRSSGQVIARRHIHYHRSKILYYEKHYGNGWATLLHQFVRVNMFYQLIIESAKWLLGHKRPMRAQRITVYRQILSTNLRATSKEPPIVV